MKSSSLRPGSFRTDAVALSLSADELEALRPRARAEYKRQAKIGSEYEPKRGDDHARRVLEGMAARASLLKHLGRLNVRSIYTAYGTDLLLSNKIVGGPKRRCVRIVGRMLKSGEWSGHALGWAWSYEGPTLGEWRTGIAKPAWVIPMEALHSMETLS